MRCFCGLAAHAVGHGVHRCPVHGIVEDLDLLPPRPLRAHTASCCLAHADSYGRLPIGYCSPECQRRAS